jgi:FtsP/CotA-like multicopper oxidase with cupredoxin domain
VFSPDLPTQSPHATSSDRTVTYTLSGNMMGSTSWTINGRSYPDVDPTQVKLGQRIRLRVTNMSMEPHPMHLHGQPFDVVTVNGRFVNPSTKDTRIARRSSW